jgi:hypothetical protein
MSDEKVAKDYKSLAQLSTADVEMASAFVCPAFRVWTLAIMLVLIVG